MILKKKTLLIFLVAVLSFLPYQFARAQTPGSGSSKVRLEKRVYNCEPEGGGCKSTDGRSVEKSTFEPGDIAGVSIKINSSTETLVNFDLRDFLPAEAVSPIEPISANDRNKYCHIDAAKQVLTGMSSQDGYVQWSDLTASPSDQYLCYSFGVGEVEDAKHKNIVNQINAIAYSIGGANNLSVGDANGDGRIDISDQTIIEEIVTGIRTVPGNICQVDANQDGKVNIQDAVAVANIISGKSQSPGQCSTGSGDFENVIGSSNNYLMVRGYPFIQSQESPNLLDATVPYKINKIEDELAFAFTRVLLNEQNQVASSVPSYLYLRGSGQKSRGGTLVSLPVKMTDMSESKTFFSDQFYLLYNPLFYIFGNMFSGSAPSSTAFDFGHGSSAISEGEFGNEKLNSASSLYNYYFDEKSVIFWDRNNKDKNSAMEGNISRILGSEDSRPDNFCALNNASYLSGSSPIYLNNKSCSLRQPDTSSVWPNGRVWYLQASSDIKISSTILRGGTLVVDFSGASYVPTVKINTKESDFSNNSFLGLIVINGGRVEFTKEAEYFRGAVFVPGRSDSDPGRRDGEGKIIFAEDGRPLKIRGSLIADEIDFNKRQKNDKEYAVSVYSDSALINSRIPGFERLMSVLIGK